MTPHHPAVEGLLAQLQSSPFYWARGFSSDDCDPEVQLKRVAEACRRLNRKFGCLSLDEIYAEAMTSLWSTRILDTDYELETPLNYALKSLSNSCYSHQRRHATRKSAEQVRLLLTSRADLIHDPDPTASLHLKSSMGAVRDELAKMRASDQRLFEYRESGLSFKAIGVLMDMPRATAHHRFKRIIGNLRTTLTAA